MAGEDVIRRVVVKATTEGTDQAAAALNKITAAQDGLSASSAKVTVTQEKLTRGQLSVVSAYDRLKQKTDDAYRAQVQFEKGQSLVDRALQQGVIGAKEHATTLGVLQSRLASVTQANDNHTQSTGLNRAAMLELGHVAKSTFESLASGAPIFTVLAQQGASTAQALSMGGGIGAALEEVGTSAKALLTPAAAVIGTFAAVTAAAIVAGKAAYDYGDQQDHLSKALTGVGRQSGATLGSINAIAASSASAAHVSVSSARDMQSAFASTGKIGVDAFSGLITTTAAYAKATGLDLPEATAKVAAAMADPVKGALELNKGLGFLSGSTLHYIETLDAQGEHTKAQQVLMNAMVPQIADLARQTNAWAASWEAVKTAASNAYDATGKAVYNAARQPTLQERIVTEANRPKAGEVPWYSRLGQDEYSTGTQTRDDSSLEYMQEDARRQGALGMSQMRAGYSATKSLEAKGVIDQLTPSNADVLQLTKWQTSLKEALAAGDAPSGTEAALKRIKDLIAAGGTETFNLMKSARDAFDQAPLLTYERGLAQIETKYRDLRTAAGPGASAATLSGISAAHDKEVGAFNTQAIANPLRDANTGINEQIASMKVQRDGFLAGTAAAAEMAAKQDMINKFARDGIDIMKSNADAVGAYAKRAGEAALANENLQRTQQNIVAGMDELRSGTQGALTGMFSAARQGQDIGKALLSSVGKMADQGFDRLISKPLTESVFGFMGKPGGGAIGKSASTAFGKPAISNDNGRPAESAPPIQKPAKAA